MGLVCGVGWNDLGRGQGFAARRKWKSMLQRVYVTSKTGKTLSYEGCSVCSEWLVFSNFKAWYEENHIEGYHLDKDILVPGNKIYGPDTCSFVPQELNMLIKERDYGVHPMGVDKQLPRKGMVSEMKRPYRVRVFGGTKQTHVGYFSTAKEAHKAWQIAKSKVFQDMVLWYAGQPGFNTTVADALMARSWELLLDAESGKQTIRN